MKLLKLLTGLSLVIFLGATAAYFFALDSPKQVAESIQAAHAEAPQVQTDIATWGSRASGLGLPFRTVGELSRVVDGVETARTADLDVVGVQVNPWQTIRERVPGADVLDTAIGAASDAIRLSDAIDDDLSAVQRGAQAYDEAMAVMVETPTRETVAATTAAAETLRHDLENMRESVQPVVAALASANEACEQAETWLDGITPAGVREGVLIRGLRQAVRIADGVAELPTERLTDLDNRMAASVALLSEIETMDDRLRPPVGPFQ